MEMATYMNVIVFLLLSPDYGTDHPVRTSSYDKGSSMSPAQVFLHPTLAPLSFNGMPSRAQPALPTLAKRGRLVDSCNIRNPLASMRMSCCASARPMLYDLVPSPVRKWQRQMVFAAD